MKPPVFFIRHRVNRKEDLKTVDPAHGVEIDIRSDLQFPERMHLSHDPWVRGDELREWLFEFKKRGITGPLLLNTKEDGLEGSLVKLLEEFAVTNYLFLDTASPTLVRRAAIEGQAGFLVRFSRFETLEAVSHYAGKAEWLWVDCFEGEPISVEQLYEAKTRYGFKVILVSPELHGKSLEAIELFAGLLSLAEGVCTKSPQSWELLLNRE